jgi:uncharacterized protein YgiM (DUF1202 family)
MTKQFRLRWPVDSRRITQRFGENPQVYAKYNQAGHEGLDFSSPVGGNIYACADGEVSDIRPNDGNAYGLYVRLQHGLNGQVYETVYAHLSKVLVTDGQAVKAGEVIALSGNTGHSFGPHLHLTLKLIGAKTPGYPDGVIDPFPYLQEGEPPAPSGLTVYTSEQVRLRSGPTTASAHLAWMGRGEVLTVLGDKDAARAKVGQDGQWIQVRRANGMDGHVAAWYVQLHPPAPEEVAPEPEPELVGSLVVYATEPLNVRNGPSAGTSRVAIALPDEPLEVFGDAHEALTKMGDRGEWLRIRLSDGSSGYVAAWYVQTQAGAALPELLTVSPIEDMNMRERPVATAQLVGRPAYNTPLTVRDDPERAKVLVGRYGEWLYVETPEGKRGWVAAWYVQVHVPSFASLGLEREPEPAGPVIVYATESLSVHTGPSLNTSRIAIALPHEPLTALGNKRAALSRLGRQGEWLQVRLPDDSKGYVAAWYVGIEAGPAPSAQLIVYPTQDMNMRQRPDVGSRQAQQVKHNAPLIVHDDLERARVLVGRYDEWLYVETEEGERGWVAAWYVSVSASGTGT